MPEGQPATAKEFNRECRWYFYYIADVKRRMDEIRMVDHRMTGVHSIDFERVRSKSHKRADARIISFIELNTELSRQLEEAEAKLMYIINTIGRIPDPSFRPIIWMIYVQGMRIADVADLYGMSGDYLSQLVSAQVRRLFPEEDAE